MKIDKLDLFWINFKTFLTRPITFLICAPILMSLLGLFFFRFKPTDPDLWWHLQVGKDIFKYGIQYGDIYSYTRYGYQWIDHEWLLNCIVFLLYAFGNKSFYWLAIVFGVITLFSFYYIAANSINQKRSDAGQVALWLSLLITILAALPYLGIRAQTISNLGLSILLGAFLLKANWERGKFIWFKLPFLFLIWANLHGSVITGLFIIFIELICSIFKEKSFSQTIKSKFTLLFLCTLITLINPYGLQLYEETLRVFIDKDSHYWIDEWKALNFNKENTYLFSFYLVSFIGLLLNLMNLYSRKIYNYYKNPNNASSTLPNTSFKNFQIVISLIFLIMAIQSVRHIPLFLIVNSPIYCALWETFFKQLKYKSHSLKLKVMFVFLIVVYCISFSFMSSQASNWILANKDAEYITQNYPSQAIDYILLKPELRNQNIFTTEYVWGNFIPWYSANWYSKQEYSKKKSNRLELQKSKIGLEEKIYTHKKIYTKRSIKVFIDGRMPSWGVQLPWEKQIASKSINDINFCELNFEKEIPEQKHFLNNRINNVVDTNNFPQQTILQEYKQILFAESGYEKLINKYKIELILAKKSNFKNQYSEDFKKNWKKIYEDDLSILMKRL